jgi:tetratricopeptide (TPR) repeat protein
MEQNIAESNLLLNAWVWFDKNRKPVLFGVVAVAVAGVVASTMVWSRNQKELSAGEALSQALLAQVSSGGRTDAAAGLLRVASSYAGTSAGAQALLLGAGALFASGKHAEAQAPFEQFVRGYVSSPLMPQAKLGVAACLAAQGKTEEATRAYKDLLDRYPSANTAPQAQFALAGIYESQGKLDDAFNLFEQIARADPNGALGSEAGMRAEELRLKLPPVTMPVVSSPAVMPTTNATTYPPK